MPEQRTKLNPLELAKVPLKGRVLIEASAGTGKTWTIAALYVRLLLESRLKVQDLLVLTFTNAATAELRARIRKRLVEVREALEKSENVEGSDDPLLQHLLNRSADPNADRLWINAAIESFDLASIYTIHAFCQRALAEHAFESGRPFESELLNDDRSLLEMMVRDCWRVDMQAAHPLWAEWLDARNITPAYFVEKIPVINRIENSGIYTPPVPSASVESQYIRALDGVREQWMVADEAFSLIENAESLNRSKYSKRHLPGWRADLAAHIYGSTVPAAMPKCLERFTPLGLAANVKQGQAPSHPLFEALAYWQATYDAFHARLAHWTVDLARRVDARLREYKQERRLQSYDDLLRELDGALSAEGGVELAEGLRRRYAAALIDEFQDTDPRQYGIFEKIYAETDSLRCFVGDPKQAIYSFRGADVHAYLHARRQAEFGFTLDINRRSVPPLVEALNRLFAMNPRPFIEKGIEFLPVASIAADEFLHIESDIATAPLQCWFMAREEGEKQIAKGRAHALCTDATADEIANLLTSSAQGRAFMRSPEGDRPLAGRDIAVLVRKHSQALRVREALAARGVASVTYGQDSVYKSAEAEELARVLRGIAEVSREDLLLAALGTELLGRDAPALAALKEDDPAWTGIVERYADYHNLAREQGFIRMWRKLLIDENVPARLLSFADGARRLTNIQHLADLLHQAACQDGLDLEQMVRLLESEAAVEINKVEAHQLRLESDENLVQILTIHMAKGLEFPLVYCPFLWDDKVQAGELTSFHVNDVPAVDLGSADLEMHSRIAREEELAERLRLAYVALTRAKHRCVFTWGAAKEADDSAPAWLLHGKDCESREALIEAFKAHDDAHLSAVLARLEQESKGAFSVCPCPRGSVTQVTKNEIATSSALHAKVFQGAAPQPWRVSSFTGLLVPQEHEAPDYDALTIAVEGDLAQTPGTPLMAFPGGVRTGTMIHQLFEGIDFRTPAESKVPALVRTKLEEFGFEPNWASTLERMLSDVVRTPLNDSGLRLDKVSPAQRLIEMEFVFPVEEADLSGLRAALAPLREIGSRLPEAIGTTILAPQRGFIKGFIDLVFEYDGRYYLADYKSNRLGASVEGYAPARLALAMSESWYDLQYLLYTLALHRYLRQRIRDYDYERHFGGVYYLFVRGMSPEQGSSSGVYYTRPSRSLIEALDRVFSAKERV